jgi:hypothetical protein
MTIHTGQTHPRSRKAVVPSHSPPPPPPAAAAVLRVHACARSLAVGKEHELDIEEEEEALVKHSRRLVSTSSISLRPRKTPPPAFVCEDRWCARGGGGHKSEHVAVCVCARSPRVYSEVANGESWTIESGSGGACRATWRMPRHIRQPHYTAH